jgi:hypothetical protein
MDPDPVCCNGIDKIGAVLDLMMERNVDCCLVRYGKSFKVFSDMET